MKKIKKIFVTPNEEYSKQIKQNQKEKCVKNDIQSINSEQNDKQKHSMRKNCFQCQKNAHFINKYEVLIKLLKIKIMRLEKRIEIQNIHDDNDVDKINKFQDFTMDLDTASLETLKNFTQKNLSPFKVLKFDPNLKADKDQKYFDKTVLKFEKTGKVKSAKHLKNILDDFRICPQDMQNEIYPHSKTSKSINKRLNKVFSCQKISDVFGKQISFIKLMQKSQFSINTSKNIIFEEYSTIKRSGSIEKCNSIDLDELKSNQDKINEQNQEEKKLRILAERIQFLTETIIDLKSFLMHVRHSIFQFTKMTDIEHLRKHGPSSYETLRIIMRIFQFSEDEMQEMISSKNKKRQQNRFHNFFFSTLAR